MAANLRIKPTATKSGIWKYFDDCLDGQHAKCKLCLSAGQEVKYKIRRSNFQGIQINFAPPRPAGFANFRGAGRGKTCFFAGRGSPFFAGRGGAGRGAHPCCRRPFHERFLLSNAQRSSLFTISTFDKCFLYLLHSDMMSLAGGKIASFLDKKQWESVTEWRNWDGWQIGRKVLSKIKCSPIHLIF